MVLWNASFVIANSVCNNVLLISEGAVGYSADVPTSDRPHSETATYVNIPVSPTSKKQLHYMELELQEPSTSVRGKEVHDAT